MRTFFCLARSHMRPGCGNRPTSGGLPPATRERISVSQDPACVYLTVNPFAWAKVFRSFWNSASCGLPNPYITSTVAFPGPEAVASPLVPDPPLLDRHPDARPATATATRAVTLALRVITRTPPLELNLRLRRAVGLAVVGRRTARSIGAVRCPDELEALPTSITLEDR